MTKSTTASFYPISQGAALPKTGPQEVGNKAWSLLRMASVKLPVPAGFVLPTAWCQSFRRGELDDVALKKTLEHGIAMLQSATHLGWGSPRYPLLLSVRSGGAVSMPGMMETILDVGLNPETVDGMIRLTGNPRLAWDCYRRLVQGYAEVVCQLPTQPFDSLLSEVLTSAQVETEWQLDFRSLRDVVRQMLGRFEELSGKPFPQDPGEQLKQAVIAVFRSWDAPKAATYRKLNKIDNEEGTAVTIQVMVFGNAGGSSGSGVAFTRNPVNGEPELYLDFQFNGQGDDVVAGRQITEDQERLRLVFPHLWIELQGIAKTLESLFLDAQDFEFTLQAGTLYLLQSRSAKRTPWAALRIAVDLVQEGLIQPSEALSRLAGIDLESVTRTRLVSTTAQCLAQAKVAGHGVAVGAVALDSQTAERMAKAGTPTILVRKETSTADITGIANALGILTAYGGRTSHAAVVARQLGKVCLVGCPGLTVDLDSRMCTIAGQIVHEGDTLSLDGNEGKIYSGALTVMNERPERELKVIASWQNNVTSAAPVEAATTGS